MAMDWDALLKYLTPEASGTAQPGAYFFDAADLQRRLAGRRKPSEIFPTLAPRTPEEYAARDAGPSVGTPAMLPPVAPPAAYGARGYRNMPSTAENSAMDTALRNEVFPSFTKGSVAPGVVEQVGDITRSGNTFSGTGTAPASDLGSPAHWARIGAADKALYDTKVAISEGYTSAAEKQDIETKRERDKLTASALKGNRNAAAVLAAQYGLQGDLAKTGVAANTAANKLALDQKELLIKGITAMADAGDKEAGSLLKRMQASEIAAGRGPNSSAYTIPQTMAMYPGGAQPVLDKRTGKMTLETPKARVTEENIQASMKERKMTREKTLELYRAQGFDVTGL